MRERLLLAQRPTLLSITRCFRTTSTAAIYALAAALPLDLLKEESRLARTLRLNCDLHYCLIHFSVDEIQRSVECHRTHPVIVPFIDWAEPPPPPRH